MDFQLDLRVELEELGERLGKPGELIEAEAEGERALLVLLRVLHIVDHGAVLLLDAHRILVKLSSGLRQPHVSFVPLEEPDAQILLQAGNVPAHGRLGDVASLRRCGEI